jgi:hypothetical protein
MKRPGLTSHLLVATLFLLASRSAIAQETASSMSMTPPASRGAEVLKRYDKNGDGRLDDDERADAREAMMAEQIDRQMARPAAAAGGVEVYRARVLALFDRNQDGRLDDEERAAAQKFAEDRTAAPAETLREELFKRFDRNANGRIDAAERPAAQEFFAAFARPPAAENTAEFEAFIRRAIEADATQRTRFDEDGDGKLSDAEWQGARRRMLIALGGDLAMNPSPAEEQARLQQVVQEVARRRVLREQAVKAEGDAGPQERRAGESASPPAK